MNNLLTFVLALFVKRPAPAKPNRGFPVKVGGWLDFDNGFGIVYLDIEDITVWKEQFVVRWKYA